MNDRTKGLACNWQHVNALGSHVDLRAGQVWVTRSERIMQGSTIYGGRHITGSYIGDNICTRTSCDENSSNEQHK